MMKRLSDEDGLRWGSAEISSPSQPAARRRVGRLTLAGYALGFTLMVVAAAESLTQVWGR